MHLRDKEVYHIHRLFFHVQATFIQNNARKNYFLSACLYIDPEADIEALNRDCPYGGIIGIDDSNLDSVFNRFKVFRLHAILHDAAGYMKAKYNKGPGYCYVYPLSSINNCFLGHVTGIAFCLYLKIAMTPFYRTLLC